MYHEYMPDDRIKALSQLLGVDTKQLSIPEFNDQIVQHGNREYLVVTDEEADVLWDEDLDSYIDDVILPEIPEPYRAYFDGESFKDDARDDGRAHSLASYDGKEEFEIVTGDAGSVEFYIYRTN